MKVTTVPIQQKPEVVITLSWEEAEVLREICGNINSSDGRGRRVTNELHDKFRDVGLRPTDEIRFSGRFL